MMTNILRVAGATVLLVLLSACASNLQGDSYSRSEARQIQQVQYGTIEDIRLVVIEGTKTPIGTAAGAAIGGIAGSGVGDGKGAAIATVVGAVAGGLAGSAVEEAATKKQGVELIVRLANSNRVIAVVQANNPDRPIYVGDRVRVITINGRTRVTQ